MALKSSEFIPFLFSKNLDLYTNISINSHLMENFGNQTVLQLVKTVVQIGVLLEIVNL